MTDLKFTLSVSSCLFCCVLLQACQSIPTQQPDLCETKECSACDVSCETPHSQIKKEGEKPPVKLPPDTTTGSIVSSGAQLKLTPLLCNNANRFEHKVIGNGHCVSLIRVCSDAPTTKYWQAGEQVTKSSPEPGTVIATFANGEYPNRKGYHAAIFISQDQDGIWVWDQWRGKAVHKRLIRFGNKRTEASNSAQAYRIVKLNQSQSLRTN